MSSPQVQNALLLFQQQKDFFLSGATRSIEFRKTQIRKLQHVLKQNEHRLYEAIEADFKKSKFMTYVTEFSMLYGEMNYTLAKLELWSKRQAVPTNLANLPGKSYIIPEPYGNTLIIGTWNYPYLLLLQPLISSIAAGNVNLMKTNTTGLHTAALMRQLINDNFNPHFLHMIDVSSDEIQSILEQCPFDKLFYTGSTNVGKQIMRTMSQHLTHLTLELGGKSPAIFTEDAINPLALKRLIWGKFVNAGQTCVAPDYVLVPASKQDEFIQQAIVAIEKEFGNHKHSPSYNQIISNAHLQKIKKLMIPEKVCHGGEIDEANRYIAPTILRDVSIQDPIMQEEVFGPLLPIIPYQHIDEAIQLIQGIAKPLALYIFTQDKSIKNKLLQELRFGGGCVNDSLMHLSNHHLPFGGVGASGCGSYHGKYGFQTFSHYKSILEKHLWIEYPFKFLPYTRLKKKILQWFLE